tara:strand:- start:246 stop:980 length:735 start_codon:yes stop_codon:yes gene_type:complete
VINLVLVIPCYNEANRFLKDQYLEFLNSFPENFLIFVNDGSKDETGNILKKLYESFSQQIHIINLAKNKGKSNAIRTGMLYANESLKASKIGYLDADLATSFEEIIRLSSLISNESVFIFGSRILKIDNEIIRKKYRFIIGRIIATIISKILRERIYDTQCGCKVLTFSLIPLLFNDKFISTWLFDVELFFRLKIKYGEKSLKKLCKEIPLKKWVDTDDSRVSFLYIFKIWLDLYKINSLYNKK